MLSLCAYKNNIDYLSISYCCLRFPSGDRRIDSRKKRMVLANLSSTMIRLHFGPKISSTAMVYMEWGRSRKLLCISYGWDGQYIPQIRSLYGTLYGPGGLLMVSVLCTADWSQPLLYTIPRCFTFFALWGNENPGYTTSSKFKARFAGYEALPMIG